MHMCMAQRTVCSQAILLLQVKPLAVLAMIDDGELDWKVIAIRADDPQAAGLNDVEDVERWALCAWRCAAGCGLDPSPDGRSQACSNASCWLSM